MRHLGRLALKMRVDSSGIDMPLANVNRLIALNPQTQPNIAEQFARGAQTRLNLDASNMQMGQGMEEQRSQRRDQALGAIANFGVSGAESLGFRIPPEIKEAINSDPNIQQQLKSKYKAGTFEGTSMDAQALNLLQKADPASPEYDMAYSYYTTPKIQMTPEGPITINRKLPSFVVPPAGQTVAGQTEDLSGISRVKGMEKLSPNQLKYNNAYGETSNLVDAYNRYVDIAQRIVPENPTGWASVSSADYGQLISAYNNLKLASKGKAMFELGVLSGPDETIIENTMINPISAKGTLLGRDAVLSSVAETGRALKGRLGRLNETYTGGQVKTKGIPELKMMDFKPKESSVNIPVKKIGRFEVRAK